MMLPNKKMDPWDNQNEESVVKSSEPHVVVACPSCKTKFAVEGSLIASFEIPRFHCSRCDAVFEPPKTLSSTATLSTERPTRDAGEARWILEDSSGPMAHGQTSHKTTPTSEKPLLKSSDFSLGTPQSLPTPSPRPSLGAIEERSGLSLLGLNLSATWLSPTSLTRAATRPRGTPESSSGVDNHDPFSLFDPPSEPTRPLETQPATAVPQATSVTTNLEATPVAPVEVKEQKKSVAPPRSAPIKPNEAPLIPQQKARANILSSGLSQLSYRNFSLSVLSGPIVFTFVVLTIIAYASRLMPQTADATLHALVPALISGKTTQVPPSELSVRDLSLEFTRTQSREVVGVVRGVVHNATTRALDDVQLEALGFDERGEIVTRAQAPLRSALAREKISDLPLATVKKFQESLSARSAKINSDEKVAFVIAFLDPEGTTGESVDLSKIKYFSARVFSVSNQ